MKLPKGISKLQWRTYLPIAGIVIGVASLLFYKLSTLGRGVAGTEAREAVYTHNFYNILHNPLSAPLTLLHWLVSIIDPHYGQLLTRIPSVIFGILTLAAMYYIMRTWYGRRAGLFGIILFACSSWFLHNSRLGTNDIIDLWALPTLLATLLIWDKYRSRIWVNYLAVGSLLTLMYVPGMAWLIIVALLLQPHHLTETWTMLGKWQHRAALAVITVLVWVPLVMSFIQTPNVGREWLALPQHFNSSQHVIHRLAQSVTFAVYRGPIAPEIWLDRMPVLDIFTMAMALAGALFYIRHFTAARSRLLLGIGIVSAMLFSLGGPVNYGLLTALWYILAAGGIGYLLHEWLHVFPHNPLARAIGYGLISVAVLFSCVFNIRSYFVAWPHSPVTISVFKHKL